MKIKNNRCFFTIIIVSYNAEKTIRATIESVLKQNYTDYEIIVKDGCSTDKTLERIPNDDRIHIESDIDLGIYDAMNIAAKIADGKYLLFLNCGDELYNADVLKKIYIYIKRTDCPSVVYGDMYHVALGKIIKYPKRIGEGFFFRSSLCHQTVFYKKPIFDEYEYDLKYSISADRELFIRLIMDGKTFAKADCVISRYLGGGVSESRKGVRQIREERMEYLKENYTVWKRVKYMFPWIGLTIKNRIMILFNK